MGFGVPDRLDEKGVGVAVAGVLESPVPPVSCSICLDVVIDGGKRSTAKLQCGHQFHLDCIGSAFNAKGIMQCPNCRKVEKGNWLYASGYRPIPVRNMDDYMHDENLYDLNYPEMPFGVHWNPFNRLAQTPLQIEEAEFSTPSTHHDFLGHLAVFADHPAVTSSTHPRPNISYFQPLLPSSSSGSQLSTEGMVGSAPFHNPWNNLSGPVDISNSHAFPAVDLDLHHQSWDSHSPPTPNTRLSGAEQASISSSSARSERVGSDAHRRPMYTHSFVIGQRFSARASSSSGISSTPPHFVGNSRGHTRSHEHHSAYQHQHTPSMRGPIPSGVRRPSSIRALAPIGPAASPAEHTEFLLFSPTASVSRTAQDTETSGGSQLHAWERNRLAANPFVPVDGESAWWGSVTQASSGSESRNQRRFWRRRHGFNRPSPQFRYPHHLG